MSFIILRHELNRTKRCPAILLIYNKSVVMCQEVATFELKIAVLSLLGKE